MKWILLSAFYLLLSPARSAVVWYEFTGTTASSFRTLPAGTPFSVNLTYQQDQTPISTFPRPPYPIIGASYTNITLSMMLGTDYYSLGQLSVNIWDYDWDTFEAYGMVTSPLGVPEYTVHLLLRASGSIWAGMQLPGPGLTLTDFDDTAQLILGGSSGISSPLTSITSALVPEPGAVATAGAVSVLLLLRRRRGGRIWG